ncbi:MAG: competence/damage-inducible protein A, partial [Alphaproteobacteria bacterium]
MSVTPPTPATEEVTACLIIIGNEILSGRTRDANLPYLAKGLNGVGVQLRETRVIPDIETVIVETVNECRALFDYVFTTGGIGPTHDDITSASIAKAFGVGLRRDPEVVAAFERYYADERGIELNDARLRMAEFPEGAEVLPNAITIAPGYRMDNVF